MLLRDRKAILSALLSFAGYAAVLLVVADLAVRRLVHEAAHFGALAPPGSLLAVLLWINAVALVWRLSLRAQCSPRTRMAGVRGCGRCRARWSATSSTRWRRGARCSATAASGVAAKAYSGTRPRTASPCSREAPAVKPLRALAGVGLLVLLWLGWRIPAMRADYTAAVASGRAMTALPSRVSAPVIAAPVAELTALPHPAPPHSTLRVGGGSRKRTHCCSLPPRERSERRVGRDGVGERHRRQRDDPRHISCHTAIGRRRPRHHRLPRPSSWQSPRGRRTGFAAALAADPGLTPAPPLGGRSPPPDPALVGRCLCVCARRRTNRISRRGVARRRPERRQHRLHP